MTLPSKIKQSNLQIKTTCLYKKHVLCLSLGWPLSTGLTVYVISGHSIMYNLWQQNTWLYSHCIYFYIPHGKGTLNWIFYIHVHIITVTVQQNRGLYIFTNYLFFLKHILFYLRHVKYRISWIFIYVNFIKIVCSLYISFVWVNYVCLKLCMNLCIFVMSSWADSPME